MRTFLRYIGNKGFSAIELLLAMIIAGLLIGASMPAFLSMVQRSRIDGGSRQVLYEIRSTQSLAISRGGVFGFQWGGDPGPAPPPVPGQLNSTYRIVLDTTGACGFPLVGAPVDGTSVIRGWFNLAGEYQGVTIQSVQDANATIIGEVMFNSRGGSVNNCTPGVTFPVTVIIADNSGVQRCVDVQRAGRVSIRALGAACP